MKPVKGSKIVLTTPKDTKECRDRLLALQGHRDALTGLPLDSKDAVLDHDHQTQRIRSVLHRQINVMEGRIANSFTRYLQWWYPNDLPTFLRDLALYLEKDYSSNPYHIKWQDKVMTEFRKCNGKQQAFVCHCFGMQAGSNSKQRQLQMKKLLKSRAVTYGECLDEILHSKEYIRKGE